MKLLKNIALCLFMAVSVAGVSTTAYAEDGRIEYKPIDAINLVLENVQAAKAALDEGKANEEVYALVKKAKDASKEINANDKVDIARTRANGHLSKTLGVLKQKDSNTKEEAMPHLDEAAKAFEALKGLL